LTIEVKINQTFVRSRSSTTLVRRHLEGIIATIIQDIRDHNDNVEEAEILEAASSEANELENESIMSKTINSGLITDWTMDTETYDILCTKLPRRYETFKIIFNLNNGILYIRVVPGDLHAAASTAFNYAIESWANNSQPVLPGILPPLRNRSDTSKYPRLFF
jgi:hypothetical protein